MPAGRLTVIPGPMFAGKSTELLRRVRRATLARIAVAVFKPAMDARALGIRSHDGLEAHALSVPSQRLVNGRPAGLGASAFRFAPKAWP